MQEDEYYIKVKLLKDFQWSYAGRIVQYHKDEVLRIERHHGLMMIEHHYAIRFEEKQYKLETSNKMFDPHEENKAVDITSKSKKKK